MEELPGIDTRPAGIEGSQFAGPFPVGEYASKLRERLRGLARVQVFGEVANLGIRQKAVYFELRDERGALPCSMWRSDYDKAAATMENGAQVVLGGGCDYYPGSATSSPSFSFRATELALAGEGELLAKIERLRKQLGADGLTGPARPQAALAVPALPRSIGIVTGEAGMARGDILAALTRRGWAGRLVWAFAPVQDRTAAPKISQALRDLAADGGVDVIIVARGGGSVTDLMAFSDEALCRTVAMLPVPVIASIGHHDNHSLIDDVAAISCSTPTHVAEQAVRIDIARAREATRTAAGSLQRCGNRALVQRARRLIELARAPSEHVARHRRTLHQQVRELRAAGTRGTAAARRQTHTRALVLDRKAGAAAGPDRERRARELERLALALAAHDPGRTLARGYALVEDREGAPVTTAAAARSAGQISVRFHDDRVRANVEDER